MPSSIYGKIEKLSSLLRLHDYAHFEWFSLVFTTNFNLANKSGHIRNQRIGIVNEEHQLFALRMITIDLDVIMQLSRYVLAMPLIPYVLRLDNQVAMVRDEILDTIS